MPVWYLVSYWMAWRGPRWDTRWNGFPHMIVVQSCAGTHSALYPDGGPPSWPQQTSFPCYQTPVLPVVCKTCMVGPPQADRTCSRYTHLQYSVFPCSSETKCAYSNSYYSIRLFSRVAIPVVLSHLSNESSRIKQLSSLLMNCPFYLVVLFGFRLSSYMR